MPAERTESATRPKRQLPLGKKIAYSLVILIVFFGILEAACTAFLPAAVGSTGSDTFTIQEDTGGFCLDLNQGYRIKKTPARLVRVIKGQIEYLGAFRGNAQGFQGDKDFSIKKPAGVKTRWIVFGDSFTSAAFNETQWTRRAEEARFGEEFLNFGIDGAGLANWWSVLTRIILPQHYEFDRVIFAAIPDDLDRPFMMADSRSNGVLGIGFVSFNPQEFPRKVEEAFLHFDRHSFRVVTSADFDESLRTRRLCLSKESHAAERLWITGHLLRAIDRRLRRLNSVRSAGFVQQPHIDQTGKAEYFVAFQLAMILDLRDRLAALHKPITVISIPFRDDLLMRRDGLPNVREFARLLGAEFINGTEPFMSLTDAEIRACYFPHDGHWSQVGSDRFAAYVAQKLK